MDYKRKYNKEHYKSFKVDLKIDEFNLLDEELKNQNLSKAEFLRIAMKLLLEKKIKNEGKIS